MIVTFYSYKGGVGRTQLLANLAAYYCHNMQKKVLLIDWDLEAPGLHCYFGIKENDIQAGLMDLLFDYTALMRQTHLVDEDLIAQHDLFPTEKQILKCVENKEGRIDLLTAGKYDNEYFKRMNSFDWNEFYDTLDGKIYIELFKKHLKQLDYDFIFIDSRTGVNDYSGICNIQLPDLNVLLFAPNNQNYEGALRMASNILNSPYSKKYRDKTIILPLLSRIDDNSDFYEEFTDRFVSEFGFLIKNLTQYVDFKNNKEEYYEKTRLDYAYKVASGENLLFGKKAKPKIGLTEKYIYIANLLEDIANIIITNGKDAGKILNPQVGIDILEQLAKKHLEEKQYELAIENYRQILQRDPVRHDVMLKLADICSEIGNFHEALELYSQSLAVLKEFYPSDKYSIFLSYERLGNVYLLLGQFEKSLNFLNLGVELSNDLHKSDPNDGIVKYGLAVSYANLGAAYSTLGEFDKALEYFNLHSDLKNDLYKSNPENESLKKGLAISFSNLGEIYTKLDQFDKALEYFNLSSELYKSNVNNEDFKRGLAISYCKLGATNLSLNALDNAKINFQSCYEIYKTFMFENSERVDNQSNFAEITAIIGILSLNEQVGIGNNKFHVDESIRIWNKLYDLTKISYYKNKINIVTQFINGDIDYKVAILQLSME